MPIDTIKAWPDKQLLKYCALLSMSIEDPKTTKEEAESCRETLAMVKAEYLSRSGPRAQEEIEPEAITIVGHCCVCHCIITSNMSYNLVEGPNEGDDDIPLCNKCAE
jgi:hypothetical protein